MHIALTDTFSSEVFFQASPPVLIDLVFPPLTAELSRCTQELTENPEFAHRWRGIRQDSGDSIKYAHRAREFYQNLGIDISTKTIVFSDGLNVEKCCEIKKVCNELGINRKSHQLPPTFNTCMFLRALIFFWISQRSSA
jgi:nicotinate phosphoribosyltransferase